MKNKKRVVVASRKEQDKCRERTRRANKEGIRRVDYGVSERKEGQARESEDTASSWSKMSLIVPWFGPEYATPRAVLLTLQVR
jgi:hypothetical protein